MTLDNVIVVAGGRRQVVEIEWTFLGGVYRSQIFDARQYRRVLFLRYDPSWSNSAAETCQIGNWIGDAQAVFTKLVYPTNDNDTIKLNLAGNFATIANGTDQNAYLAQPIRLFRNTPPPSLVKYLAVFEE